LLRASMIRGRPCPFFQLYPAFALQMRKSMENLSQGIRLVLNTKPVDQRGHLFSDSLNWPAKQQSSGARGWLHSALGLHKYL
jgi:hypothetical protein